MLASYIRGMLHLIILVLVNAALWVLAWRMNPCAVEQLVNARLH